VYLSYNGFQHANNEVSFTISYHPLRSQLGVYYADQVRWDCKGQLINYSSQAALTEQLILLENIYSHDGGDVVFYLDDGETPTAHTMYSSNCIGGTRIAQGISYPDTWGSSEYAAGNTVNRSYTFAIEGIIAFTNENVTLEFDETVELHGTGGPTQVWLPVAQGPFIQQQTTQQSTFKLTQTGSALGLYGTPTPPSPLYPENEIQPLRSIRQGTPKLYGAFHWPVSWSYTFEATGGMNAQASSVAGY
jgi:hypothetical protein